MIRLYTVREVAKILRVRRGYVYELIAQGRLKAVRISERRTRIPESTLKEFLGGWQEDERAAAK